MSEDIEADISVATETINSLNLEIQQIQSQLNELNQESESYETDLESLNAQLSALNQEQETNIASLETLESELQVSLEFANGLASIEQEVDQANNTYQEAITNEENALNEATGNQNLSVEEIQQIESIVSTLE
jgi:chromosome segregation ATPase